MRAIRWRARAPSVASCRVRRAGVGPLAVEHRKPAPALAVAVENVAWRVGAPACAGPGLYCLNHQERIMVFRDFELAWVGWQLNDNASARAHLHTARLRMPAVPENRDRLRA